MKIKQDATIIKCTKIYLGGPAPYRYVLRYDPKADPTDPYMAHREDMVLVGDTWESGVRYWAFPCKTLEIAEKEYLKRVETEGPKT